MFFDKQLLFTFTIIFFLINFSSYGQNKEDKWDKADSLTVRLEPSKFESLPEKIANYLEENGYTVPQCSCKSTPHNAISGPFREKGQLDWAVLASKKRVSRILIFWGGSTKETSAIAEGRDRGFLQTGAEGINFSRMIEPASKYSINKLYKTWGGPEPPPIDHMGIEDIYAYKGSLIHYYYNNKWIKLTGSD